MSRIIDLTGKKFGRLTVVRLNDMAQKKHNKSWVCRCDCGQTTVVYGCNLKRGMTRSCGCLRKEITSETKMIHGHSPRCGHSKTYLAWKHLLGRCRNPKDKSYVYYGARGIICCDRWLKFENFLTDMGEPPTKNHSIDRIDNNSGYYKENCRWATRKQQIRNRSNNRVITHNNTTQCLSAWAEEYGIRYGLLWLRIVRYGWPIGKALTQPSRTPKNRRD